MNNHKYTIYEKEETMKLWFQAGDETEHVVAEVEDEKEAWREIEQFCDGKGIAIPYTRCWGDLDEEGIWIDFGSWSEFFRLTR